MAVRTLRPDEQAIVQQIFQNGLDLTRVRVSEGSQIPNTIGLIGARLRGRPAPQANAIPVGNTSYYPTDLTSEVRNLGWPMHELTHQWQHQHFGMIYLAQATAAATYVYCNAGETPAAALARCHSGGETFASFNREQPGDIVRDAALQAAQDPNTGSRYY